MFKKRDITAEAWKWKRRPKFCTHQLIKNGEYFRVGSNGSADVFVTTFMQTNGTGCIQFTAMMT